MDETGSDSLSTRIPYGRSWTIHVDEAYAERMIRAHNKAYRRKTGKGFFIFCLLLDGLVVAGTVKCLIEGLNIFDAIGGFEALIGAYVLFPALTIFFGVLAFGPDKGRFFGRKRAARELVEELDPEGTGTCTARFDALGVTLSSGGSVIHVPYAACYSTADIEGETFVLVGSEEEQSVLRNMAGNNALMRDNVGLAFAAPAEYTEPILNAGKRQFERMQEDDTYCTRVLNYFDEA